ncbi:MAG: DUF3267 domain-containing protein [Candidatus Limnocylindrales bacterium]
MTEQKQASTLPDGVVSEWKPSRATLCLWVILSVPIFLVGVGLYAFIATHGETHATGSASLLQILLVAVLSVGILFVHEGVHGIVILAFGARPQFGVLMTKAGPIGFYATAPGHRFSWRQYLLICLAPLAVLAPLGALACWLPFGGYVVVPFALHLAGCIGDVTIAWHVLRAPSDVVCEDLRDRVRFWKPDA